MGDGAKKRSVHVGDLLGRYELVEEIGEGGMATVFRARDRELRRDVAVKVLFAHLAKRDEIVRRFQREARAAAGLEHANVLRVFDVGGGEADDPPYIVMELVRGLSLLGELEQHGALLAELVACFGAVLADALGAAHAAGIIHRDVKPANVMLATGGRVLLTDFGVARLETEDSLVTKTGAVLGTPAYMSPEQASGDTATVRSDLYSLGATLYQLATGSLPYSGPPAKVLAQIATGALVSPVRRRAVVGPDLSRTVEKLMQREPEARPASAIEVATELRALASAGGLGDPAAELAAYLTDRETFVRARTPVVVGTIVRAAQTAAKTAKLPRAMALADRASALAPDDAAVKQLVETVTRGGRAAKVRRAMAVAGAVLAMAAAGIVGIVKVGTSGLGPRASARPEAAAGADAAAEAGAAAVTVADAAAAADAVAAAAAAADAGSRAARRQLDAATPDGPALSEVRGPRSEVRRPEVLPPLDAPPAPASGNILVRSDAWCDVTIDGTAHGRRSEAPIAVEAGHHTVICEQPGTGRRWQRELEVAAGATAIAQGSLLGAAAIALAVDATIDGVAYHRGAVAQVAFGRHRVTVGGTPTWIDVRGACTLRTDPSLDCYP